MELVLMITKEDINELMTELNESNNSHKVLSEDDMNEAVEYANDFYDKPTADDFFESCTLYECTDEQLKEISILKGIIRVMGYDSESQGIANTAKLFIDNQLSSYFDDV